MKVKNIAFSGFMAAILMGVTGAHAADTSAVRVATKAYVDGKTTENATAISDLTTTVNNHTSAYNTYVAANDAAVQANASAIALKADQSALTELAGNVYTKEAADALLAGKVDNATLNNYYTKSETYTDDRIEQRITETLTSLEGGNINLGGYAKTDYVDTELAKKADKSVVDGIVTALGTTNDVTAAIADAKAAGTAAQGEVDALEGVVSTLTQTVATNKSDAENAIAGAEQAAKDYADQQITALNLDTTYEKVGVAAELDAALKTNLEGQISAAQSAAEAKVTELANGAVADNAAAIAANTAAIALKQDALSEAQLAAAGSGITAAKVDEYDAAVSELANKISMPEACKQANGNCVLGIMNQKVQWIDLTEPVEEPQA